MRRDGHVKLAQDRFALRNAAGKHFLVSLSAPMFAAHSVYRLNDTGAYLWKSLCAGADLDDVAASYVDEFGTSKEQALKDVSLFISSMTSIGAAKEE